ncbi:hypothetical protein HAX54_043356 [Datura stramonium]|uniref:Uncharacterized protein n=1 Tax=Datura stramonium TaxID=4076 RepID=A0ABS8W574_DATST|nr:hypothetical protein [Datura stramonium]
MDFKCSDLEQWKEASSAYEARIESPNKPNLVSLDDFYRMNFRRSPPRLLDFVSSLDDAVVRSASEKAFQSLPDIKKAISELTVLKGVGPATASAGNAAAIGNSKDYTLKQHSVLVDKLQAAKELSAKGDCFTPSDVERALWSSAVGVKSGGLSQDPKEVNLKRKSKRKRAQ